MASYVDLGLVKDLQLSSLSRYEKCYFLYSTFNGHLYAAFKEEDLESLIKDQGNYPIQKIDEIRKQFFNVSQVENMSTLSLASRELSLVSSISFLDMGRNISLEASLNSPISSRKRPKVFLSESKIRKTLESTQNITRSTDGTEGVYFLETEDHSLALKCYVDQDGAMKEIVADRFFQHFGFITPQYCLVSSASENWELAKNKLEPKIEQLERKKAHNLKTALDEKNDMTIMEILPGRSFKEVFKEIKDIDIARVNSQEVLKALGAMIFLDTFIGNGDRLQPNNSNPGNFFLLSEGEYGNDQKPVALLDHTHELNHPAICKGIRKKITLLLGEESGRILGEDIMDNFSMKTWGVSFDPENTCFLQEGVRQAADSLISQFGNSTKEEPQENLSSIFNGLDEPQQQQYTEQFIALVGHVKRELQE